MNSSNIVSAIKILIDARDNQCADVQSVIDMLNDKWEEMNAFALSSPTPTNIAHAAAVDRMG